MAAQETKHDAYCWHCCADNTTLKCLTCFRSFHSKCVEEHQRTVDDMGNWQCPVCIELNLIKNSKNKDRLDMLRLMVDHAHTIDKFNELKFPLEGEQSDSIVNRMDLTKIRNKIRSYTSFFELMADVHWIRHNCLAIYPDEDSMPEKAEKLVEHFEDAISDVKLCAECYSNSIKFPRKWFTMGCSKPHLILWAKANEWNHWPALLMHIDGNGAEVRFFGDHTKAVIPAKDSFLYSDTNPSLKSTKERSNDYKLALKEADVYIANIRMKYGSKCLVETLTRFDPTLLNCYLISLIPRVFVSQDRLSPINLIESDDDLTNDEPISKKARLSDGKGAECDQSFIIDSSVEVPEASNTSAAISNTFIANPIANGDINKIMTKWQDLVKESTTNFSKVFGSVCELTAKLAAHKKTKLLDQKLIDELKAKVGQLQAEKLEHDKMTGRKDKELANAVNEVKKQCEEEYERRLEASKKMEFCVACGAAKPINSIYACNADCQRRFLQNQLS